MSKELEALNDMLEYLLTYDEFNEKRHKHNTEIIKTALKRLEEHDKIFKKYDINDIWLEPSLYVIKNHFPMDTETQLKKLKTLEIIRDKKVDVPYIIENPEEKDVIWYNSRFTGVLCEGWRMLTQEEYDLLKEILL